MKPFNWTFCLAAPALLFAQMAPAQDSLHGLTTLGSGDVAATKQKAEAGDAAAQVALGDSLNYTFHASEALGWYRKAAAQGSVEGAYHVGDMLLFGAPGIPNSFTVPPDPIEGLRWTYMAATNLHPYACRNMAKALRQGPGTSTNLVAAYAWLSLFASTKQGSVTGRVELNQLALQMDTAALQQAQNLTAQFKAGHWQASPTRAIPEGDSRLKVDGISFGGRTPLVVINGRNLSEGETATVPVKPGNLKIKCLQIEKDSVLIAVEGEDTPRWLRVK